MNKLELEMSKRRLEFHREITEELVKMDKKILRLGVVTVGVGTLAVIFTISVGVGCLKEGNYISVIIEFLLALVNGGLCIAAMCRINRTKRDLKCHKAELEQIDYEIKLLKETDLE